MNVPPLHDDLIAGTVRGDSPVGAARRVPAAPLSHRGERGGEIVGGAGGETGMDTDRGVVVGVSRAHDRVYCPASGHPGYVHLVGGNMVLADDLAGDAGDERRLSAPALLLGGLEPIPALRAVGAYDLGRIGDEEGVLLGE